MNIFRFILRDFYSADSHAHSPQVVLLSLLADAFDVAPASVQPAGSPLSNPYKELFRCLSAYSETQFVKRLRAELDSKVEN